MRGVGGVVEVYAYLGTTHYAKPLEFVEGPKDEVVYCDPIVTLRNEQAQELMDALWNVGLRPTDVGTAGQLGAVEDHLQDMRSLVFDTLLPIATRPPIILPKPSALCGDIIDKDGSVIGAK
jgi:hypothetical protein